MLRSAGRTCFSDPRAREKCRRIEVFLELPLTFSEDTNGLPSALGHFPTRTAGWTRLAVLSARPCIKQRQTTALPTATATATGGAPTVTAFTASRSGYFIEEGLYRSIREPHPRQWLRVRLHSSRNRRAGGRGVGGGGTDTCCRPQQIDTCCKAVIDKFVEPSIDSDRPCR